MMFMFVVHFKGVRRVEGLKILRGNNLYMEASRKASRKSSPWT